jgi:hypothetical protein
MTLSDNPIGASSARGPTMFVLNAAVGHGDG